MSQKQLSEGICSKEYIYLLENGARTPSPSILLNMGDRLGGNLLLYFGYLDCEDPMKTKRLVETKELFRRDRSLAELKKTNDYARVMIDFQKNPRSFEIIFNDCLYLTFYKRDYAEVINTLKSFKNSNNYEIPRLHREDLKRFFLFGTWYSITKVKH